MNDILIFCGSQRIKSKNYFLCRHLQEIMATQSINISNYLSQLPIYNPDRDRKPLPPVIVDLHKEIANAKYIIIITPEYLGSIPAALKNMLEWCNEHNSFVSKATTLICYTPKAPRGEKCIDQMEYALNNLGADIKISELLHHDQIAFGDDGSLLHNKLEYPLEQLISILKEKH